MVEARMAAWAARRDAVAAQAEAAALRADALEAEAALDREAAALLRAAASACSAAGEGRAARLATLALREVFPDRRLTVTLEVGDYRGAPGVRVLMAGDGPPREVLGGFSGGAAQVLGVVLRALAVARRPHLARVLILDEPGAGVAPAAQAAFGGLLRRLCQEAGFAMIVVTHSPHLAAAAHRRYRAERDENGTVFIEED